MYFVDNFQLPFRAFAETCLLSLKAGVQVLSFYFVFTVFVTVGFGDVVPDNTAERVGRCSLKKNRQTL